MKILFINSFKEKVSFSKLIKENEVSVENLKNKLTKELIFFEPSVFKNKNNFTINILDYYIESHSHKENCIDEFKKILFLFQVRYTLNLEMLKSLNETKVLLNQEKLPLFFKENNKKTLLGRKEEDFEKLLAERKYEQKLFSDLKLLPPSPTIKQRNILKEMGEILTIFLDEISLKDTVTITTTKKMKVL